MIGSYALSLSEGDNRLLIDIFLNGAPKVEKLFLISSSKRQKSVYDDEIIKFSEEFGIRLNTVTVDDISNFFEIYLILEKICELEGTPSWINITSGSGTGLSALTVHAFLKDAPLVMYDKEVRKVIITNINKLKRIKIYQKRYFELISELGRNEKSLNELSKIFMLSRSAMSRRLRHMEMLNIVVRKGTGRTNFPYVYRLTEFGKKLL
ncbi:MAG: winged helix-turn-helix domain-containing protein [Thermoplasmata archaeon]